MPPRVPRANGRVLVRAVMWSLPLLVLAGAAYVWLQSGRYVTTDNAYVKGDRAMIAAELSGPIVEVAVKENDRVSRGQLLFRLDDQPYRTALAKIDSEIDIQRSEIRGLRAQWRTKREDIKAAQSQLNYAQSDFERQKDLAERKFAPAAKMEETRMAAEVARQRAGRRRQRLRGTTEQTDTRSVGDRLHGFTFWRRVRCQARCRVRYQQRVRTV